MMTYNWISKTGESTMNRITASVILKSFVAGLLLSGCGGFGSYVPQVRDVTERPITGDYWSQQFTLYDPANFSSDCQISRTGGRIDLNSPAEVADAWQQFRRGYDRSRD